MLPGVVTAASYSTNGGYYVTINHGICVCSYLHLSKILVRTGQRVTAGYSTSILPHSFESVPSFRHEVLL
jgi:septal ring factor EnvC (AmiA/AmiB activator)